MRSFFFGILGILYPGTALLPRPLRLKTILNNLAITDAESFYRDLVWLQQETKNELYSNEFKRSLGDFTPYEIAVSNYLNCSSKNPLSRCQNADLNFYMPENVLVKVDRMSMAHSLEVRSPLLDYRIIEFAATLPSKLKIKRTRGKMILRHLAGKHLPKSVLNQPKRGFSIPSAEWLRGELKSLAYHVIFEKSIVISDTIEKKALLRLWQQHQSGSRDHSVLLWGLTMLGLWEKHYY
jgi:asparagine synthase (glutamine-hydrolysing)